MAVTQLNAYDRTHMRKETEIIPFPSTAEKEARKHKREQTVHALEVEDAKKIIRYFEENERWIPYLLFILSCNTGRRCSDIIKLSWGDIYNPATGKIKDRIKIEEEKTHKYAEPKINSSCRNAILKYIEKTGCDPSKNNYRENIAYQLTGSHRGRVMSYNGYLKSIKAAAKASGIEYNVGTHSCRKMFGSVSMMIHPGEANSIEILQCFYNHDDPKTTKVYIGDMSRMFDMYVDDYGKFFDDHVIGDREFIHRDKRKLCSCDHDDLVSLIKAAYQAGRKNSAETDPMVHVEETAALISMIQEISI